MKKKDIYTILQNLQYNRFINYRNTFTINYKGIKRFATFNTVKYENIIEIPQFRMFGIPSSLKNIDSAPVKIMFPLTYGNLLEPCSGYVASSYLMVPNKVTTKISIKDEEPYIIGNGFVLDSRLNPYMIITLTVELSNNIEVKKINIRIDPKVMERNNTMKRIIYNKIIKPFYENLIIIDPLCPETELIICNLSHYITVHKNTVLPYEDLESFSTRLNKYLQIPEIRNSMCDLL